MNYQMDYFYGHEANQFTFFRIPKLLFSDERFIGLTSDAKILYGLMLDRMGLSVKNGWIDEKNHVYIYFTLEEAMEYMRKGKDKGVKLFCSDRRRRRRSHLFLLVHQRASRPDRKIRTRIFGIDAPAYRRGRRFPDTPVPRHRHRVFPRPIRRRYLLRDYSRRRIFPLRLARRHSLRPRPRLPQYDSVFRNRRRAEPDSSHRLFLRRHRHAHEGQFRR